MQYEDLLSNGTISLSESLATQAATTLSSTSYQQRYFPYFSNVTQQRWELGGTENGDLITTVSTNYTYDTYGECDDRRGDQHRQRSGFPVPRGHLDRHDDEHARREHLSVVFESRLFRFECG